MGYHDSQLQESNQDFAALADISSLMTQKGFPEDVIALYIEKAIRLLDKCADEFGVGTPFRYTFDNHFGRVRLRIILVGSLSPSMSEEEETSDNVSEFVTHLFMNDDSPFVSYRKIQNRIFIPCIRR